MTTPYHARFFAYELTRQGSDGVGRLSKSLSHLQEKIKDLEKKKRRQRQRIFDLEDEIMEKRDRLIDVLRFMNL